MSLLITTDTTTVAFLLCLLSVLLLSIAYPDRYIGTHPRPELLGPIGFPIVGNLFQVYPWRTRFLLWLQRMQSEFGPLWTFTMPPWGRGVIINRPEWLAHVKQVDIQKYSRGSVAIAIFSEFPGKNTPVASEGAEWRLARKTMFPIFTHRSFSDHVAIAMHEILLVTRALLRSASTKGVPIDWNDLAGRVAIAIFCKSSLGITTGLITEDVDCMKKSDAIRDALSVLNRTSSSRLLNPFWKVTEKFNGVAKEFDRARSTVRNYIAKIVRDRQSTAMEVNLDTPADFLGQLLRKPDNDLMRMRDILVTLLFAGRDNIQNALGWSLHELLKVPCWVGRMREEALRNAPEGSPILYSDLSRYHVHLAVFYETVRLWPGLPKNARVALCDDILPAIPEHSLPEVKIGKGDHVFWSDYIIMRDMAIWGADAGIFNPGRHLNADGQFVKPAASIFVGFGAGPRLCPAAQLAAYEFVACWVGIMPYFDFIRVDSTSDGNDHGPTMADAFTVTMEGPFMVSVRERE
ncbi:cytochrome P450 [Laetiporus sulphureus 93-53]|uniref:Cytochrome P450 n=1 Tax=Laetiporus sulphureus 93-53 TaxID=1314785 RepID=A0A165CH25_9APHY|nr:cytochrome P450 [Laetiporus sulphureus 93-53]KZT02794.1 cytochrome P450 [Laetiporus sulphureus 93-53]